MLLRLFLYNIYLQYYMILYDFLDIILFLSIKVNYSPCLVYFHQIMDKLFSLLLPKSYFDFLEQFW